MRYIDYKYGNPSVAYKMCNESAYEYTSDRFHGRARCVVFFDHATAVNAVLRERC